MMCATVNGLRIIVAVFVFCWFFVRELQNRAYGKLILTRVLKIRKRKFGLLSLMKFDIWFCKGLFLKAMLKF